MPNTVMEKFRLRFAPSPTGALHIGGVRTALYNYLLAKKHKGQFILRIEDTDQNRFVPGAEDYIIEALEWCGLSIDEGPKQGGEFGPYRQSERKELYQKYAQQLVDNGKAYYAFDTPEELEARRNAEKEKGNHNFKYGAAVRDEMNNSIALGEAATKEKLAQNHPYTIRLLIPKDEQIVINDLVRGDVTFNSNELDDKIIMKADGMPTYHLANIVDDHLMEITHVIRGEEWLPSTAHHVLLYRAMGWEASMPKFAHLPLILKPTGKGKLSKRDGAKLGIPVFPLAWEGATPEDSFQGFREWGFDPKAVINFLAFLGWNPGTEQELFSLDELIAAFSVEKIGKAGARFDFDKAKWFNQQYMIHADHEYLVEKVRPIIEANGASASHEFLLTFVEMMKERVTFYQDFWDNGYYFFEPAKTFDEKILKKKWKPERRAQFDLFYEALAGIEQFEAAPIKAAVEQFMEEQELKYGDVLPILRLAITGTTKGPAIFEMMELLGKDEIIRRIKDAYVRFDDFLVQKA